MENKIKVYLQYPWRFIDSSYYKNILNYPPRNVDFVNKSGIRTINTGRGFRINWILKESVRKAARFLRIPNITYTKKQSDLIHCAHCLSLNKRPWVVDFEDYYSLASFGSIPQSFLGKMIIKRLLKSKHCKKILPWSEYAKETLLKYIDDPDINKKIEILPFGFPVKDVRKKSNRKVKILFVGRYFKAKGGEVAIKVIDILTRKYSKVEGIVVSEVPEDIKKKYQNNKKIKIYNLVTQEELFKDIYPQADIFFYPGFSDTFGFSFVEAMSFKLPIVTFEGFAKSELVIDGRNGYVIKGKDENAKDLSWRKFRERMDKYYLEQAISKTEYLVKDKKLREKMGNEGYKLAKNKFSIENRNEKLKKIYEEALKK